MRNVWNQEQNCMNFLKYKWHKILFYKEVRWQMIFVLCLLFGASYLGLKTPMLVKDLSDHFHGTQEEFYRSLGFLLLNFFLVYVNRSLFQIFIGNYIRDLIHHHRQKVFYAWIHAPHMDQDQYPQGEILSRIVNDTEAIRDLLTSGAMGILIDILFVSSCIVSFLFLHLQLGLSIALFEILSLAILLWGSTLLRKYFIELRNKQADVNRSTSNVVGGLSDLYYAGDNHYALMKTDKSFLSFLKIQNTVNTLDAFYFAIAESLYPIILVFLSFVMGFVQAVNFSLLLALIDLIQRSINPIKEISGKIANIQRAYTGIIRMNEFIDDASMSEELEKNFESMDKENIPVDIPRNVPHALNSLPFTFHSLKIQIEGFSYEIHKNNQGRENFSLSHIELEGKKGEVIGVLGHSGSGKSTLLNILCGSLILKDGEIEVHGLSGKNPYRLLMNQFAMAQDPSVFMRYREKVSLVSQDSHIFSESLFFNLSLGKISFEELEKKWSYYLSKIPYLKEWGLNLGDIIDVKKMSSGQKQLIAGLRSLVLHKEIILFDEISSAMDSQLELALRNLIHVLKEETLLIIVAHRIEALFSAHRLYLMENGKIKVWGDHQELMAVSLDYQNYVKELS